MRAIGKTCGMTDHDRPRAGGNGALQYRHRLDPARRCARPAVHRGQTASAEHGYLPDKQEKATDTVIK